MAINEHLFMSKCVFEIQRITADISWHQTRICQYGKHMRHVFLSVLSPELEFEGKNNFFPKTSNTSKISSNPKHWHRWTFFVKLLFLPSKSNSGPSTECKTCPICLIFVKLANSGQMSGDVSWLPLDFKNTFWHENMPIYSHKQDSYSNFENSIGYLDFQKGLVFI